MIVEVSHISQHGIWLLLRNRELFLSHQDFPWFKDAPISAVLNVQLPQPDHLFWADLDIDLTVESIEHPERLIVAMTSYLYVPGKHLDVVTFEVKGADWIDVTAVYEALAHRRAATRAYVIFHLPEDKKDKVEPILEQVCEEAKRHGVGVIVIETLDDYETWDERVEAVRTEPAPDRLNDFVAVQLTEGAKQEIVQWFK